MADRSVVIVSNRGPVSFRRGDDGALVATRGAGGLISGLGPLVQGTGTTWIAAAITEADREAAVGGVIEAEGFRVRAPDIDAGTYRLAYDVVSNQTLWFLHHGLWDLARRPTFDKRWREAWEAYRACNRAFADVVAEVADEGAAVLVQDYHLALLGRDLAERRHDLRPVHFSHTPFAPASLIGVLPDHVAAELLSGMAAHRACSFHTARWADDFRSSCRAVLGLEPSTFVSPLASDPDDVRKVATSPECDDAYTRLDEATADRLVIARVDRIELSKNLLRGFHAYDELLQTRPEWRERVVFVAAAYPSREGLTEYRSYRELVQQAVTEINDRWSTPSWQPIVLDTDDDYPRSLALLRRYDVLLVNPIRDGLNLVAKEGPLVNEHDGVVVLSTEAGAHAELHDAVVSINPFDVGATADALDTALRMSPEARSRQAERLRHLVEARTPRDWLAEQRRAAER